VGLRSGDNQTMKVLDLQCEHQHVFEGWFGSEDDYLDQQARGLVQCPLCASAIVSKRLSAPRLNLGRARDPEQEVPDQAHLASSVTRAKPDVQDLVAMQSTDQALAIAWMAMAKRILANTDDVGDRFADEARKIHYGETKERSIRGKASAEDTQALLEEGIAVMPLFVPEALKGPMQ
jgi:hypothetical protein